MGFIEYAWTISPQKDNTKVRILKDPNINQARLETDSFGLTIRLPTPRILKSGKIFFLRQKFNQDAEGKSKIGKLFRAAVLHTTIHTLLALPKEKITPNSSDLLPHAFAKSIVRDTYVNAYLQALRPDRLADTAFSNSLAFLKIKPTDRISASSTRVMTALLCKINLGIFKGSLEPEEEQTINRLFEELMALKQVFAESFSGEQVKLEELFDQNVKNILSALNPFGPFLELPSLPHTEQIGACSIFSETETSTNYTLEFLFKKSMETISGFTPPDDAYEQAWKREQDLEAIQAFDSENHQVERQEKILSKISQYSSSTRFNSVTFPDEDYTQYLRARTLIQGGSRRVLDGLRSAQNLLDEDPGQETGVLDLTAVIQAVASQKPATDVFVKDEYLKQSFAWSILFDASMSMKVKGEYGRALAICVAEAAKELLKDPESWTLFAFNDKFHVLKDSSESYTRSVRARIGGLKFEGLTYMPDAIYLAGKMLAKRFEEQRVLVIISDGWPYGYPDMPTILKESIDNLVRKSVIVIGIGVETENMSKFFRLNASVYTQKDLVKKFSNIFNRASEAALEAE